MLESERESPEDVPASGGRTFDNKARLLLVGFVLLLAVGYLVWAAFPGNTLYYVTVDEFLADQPKLEGRSIRVVGKLVPDSFHRVEGTTRANFAIADKGDMLAATYVGVLPDLFFNPHSDIVLEGSYGDGDVFRTEAVVVKCPSKFKALREEA